MQRKESKVEMKTGQRVLFPRFSKELSAEQEVLVGEKLADYLRKHELLDPLVKAGSVDNIEDPIVFRRVLNAIYEFCKINDLSLEAPPTKTEPVYIDQRTPEEQKAIGIKLESHLKKHGLFKILMDAGSVDNIKDPIHYRRVMNSIMEFSLVNRLPLP